MKKGEESRHNKLTEGNPSKILIHRRCERRHRTPITKPSNADINTSNADMTIIFSTSNPSDPEVTFFQFQGYAIEEDFESGINLTIPSLVYADLTEMGIDTFTGYCLWSAYITILSYDPEFVPGFLDYDPPRFRFGSMVHENRGVVTSQYYINYEAQAFPRQSCLVVPPIYGGIPFNVASLPAPQTARLLIPIVQTQASFSSGIFNSFDSQRENSGLFGATDVRVWLPESVHATLTIAYWGTCPINQTVSDVFFFNI